MLVQSENQVVIHSGREDFENTRESGPVIVKADMIDNGGTASCRIPTRN